MNRIILLITVLLSSLSLNAQMKVSYSAKDAMHVTTRYNKWVIQHKVSDGETVFDAARRFHVPPAMVSDVNKSGYKDELKAGSTLYIPVGAYNLIQVEPENNFSSRPLFYKVTKYDNLFKIAHMADISQRQLKEWNDLQSNDVSEGQELFIGWIMYESLTLNESGRGEATQGRTVRNRTATSSRARRNQPDSRGPRVVRDTVIVVRKARSPLDGLPEIEKKYMQQTNMEQEYKEERGSAVFFDMQGKVGAGNTYYAFHDTARPGTIIKVHNPGTHKVIFAKVLGKLPATKEYHNSLIGISSDAKNELLITENKAWCELRYAQ